MKLTVLERLALLNILPKEGNFITLKIVRKLREDLSFSEEEIKRLEFKEDEGRVSWNPREAEKIIKDIKIGNKANSIIVEILEKLDKEKKLTDQHFTLYEKFIGE